MENLEEIFDNIRPTLQDLRASGLEIEVIIYALDAMKSNPELTITQAYMSGFNEWVK